MHNKFKNNIRDYQRQIAQSHSRILKLELENEKLERKISQLEGISTSGTRLAYT